MATLTIDVPEVVTAWPDTNQDALRSHMEAIVSAMAHVLADTHIEPEAAVRAVALHDLGKSSRAWRKVITLVYLNELSGGTAVDYSPSAIDVDSVYEEIVQIIGRVNRQAPIIQQADDLRVGLADIDAVRESLAQADRGELIDGPLVMREVFARTLGKQAA